MMGKFVTASALTLLVLTGLAAQGLAQSTPAAPTPAPPAGQEPAAPVPAAQAPAAQPDSGQEPADEGSTARRQKPRDYRKWSFNAGAGANLDTGTTHAFVRGGGFVGAAGVARNGNKYLGLRADFISANLPLRDSTQELAQATGATSYIYSVTLDPVLNFPVTKLYGGYFLFGPAYYHRTGSLKGDTTVPGSPCVAFWKWWGGCSGASIPLSGDFVNASLNQTGYNFGGGVWRKTPSGVEIYAEYRFMHASGDNTTTDFRPITIGFRW
jgi:hypothetical protein